jgi:hypothetical protein
MKSSIAELIGKTITQVVVVENHSNPTQQLFLIFSDKTSMELYGDWIKCAGALDSGGLPSVLEFIGRMNPKEITVYP